MMDDYERNLNQIRLLEAGAPTNDASQFVPVSPWQESDFEQRSDSDLKPISMTNSSGSSDKHSTDLKQLSPNASRSGKYSNEVTADPKRLSTNNSSRSGKHSNEVTADLKQLSRTNSSRSDKYYYEVISIVPSGGDNQPESTHGSPSTPQPRRRSGSHSGSQTLNLNEHLYAKKVPTPSLVQFPSQPESSLSALPPCPSSQLPSTSEVATPNGHALSQETTIAPNQREGTTGDSPPKNLSGHEHIPAGPPCIANGLDPQTQTPATLVNSSTLSEEAHLLGTSGSTLAIEPKQIVTSNQIGDMNGSNSSNNNKLEPNVRDMPTSIPSLQFVHYEPPTEITYVSSCNSSRTASRTGTQTLGSARPPNLQIPNPSRARPVVSEPQKRGVFMCCIAAILGLGAYCCASEGLDIDEDTEFMGMESPEKENA